MTRIIALVGESPQHVQFVNRLQAANALAGAVMESKARRGLRKAWSEWRTSRALGGLGGSDPSRRPRVVHRRRAEICDQVFGDQWREIRPDVDLLRVEDINAPIVQDWVAERAPDVIFDHGTSILGPKMLSLAPTALNLHWGLSPYYRGTHCTEWALIDQDPFNVGVTIHRLSARIDGGDLLAQERVELREGDCVDAINMRLSDAGTGLCLRIAKALEEGRELQYRQQDFSLGRLTLNRHWSRHLRRHVAQCLQPGGITAMTKRPSRREPLPIIRFE